MFTSTAVPGFLLALGAANLSSSPVSSQHAAVVSLSIRAVDPVCLDLALGTAPLRLVRHEEVVGQPIIGPPPPFRVDRRFASFGARLWLLAGEGSVAEGQSLHLRTYAVGALNLVERHTVQAWPNTLSSIEDELLLGPEIGGGVLLSGRGIGVDLQARFAIHRGQERLFERDRVIRSSVSLSVVFDTTAFSSSRGPGSARSADRPPGSPPGSAR